MAKTKKPRDPFVCAFGEHVRQLRTSRDLSQEQVAEVAELSVLAVSNIERGINGPRFHRLDGLAKALGVELHELFRFSVPGDARANSRNKPKSKR